MKTRLFAVVFAVFCFTNIFAADLLNFCPNDSFGAGFIDFAALRRHPQVDELLKSSDVKEKLDELSNKFGSRVEEWNQCLVFSVDNGKGDPIEGVILDIPVLNDLSAVLAELKKNGKIVDYSEKTIAGKKSFVVTAEESDEKIVLTPVAPGIVVCTQEVDAKYILSLKSGDPVAVRKQITELPEKDSAAWLTGDISWAGEDGKIDTYKLRSIFKFSGDGKKYALIGKIVCPNEETSATINMLVSMYSGVLNGVVFSQDPNLGKSVRKCLKLKSENETFSFKFEITQELILKVKDYLNSHADDLDVNQLEL